MCSKLNDVGQREKRTGRIAVHLQPKTRSQKEIARESSGPPRTEEGGWPGGITRAGRQRRARTRRSHPWSHCLRGAKHRQVLHGQGEGAEAGGHDPERDGDSTQEGK